jgi:hypothetical protein
MAHYAFLNENNIVVEVIVGKDENDLVDSISDWEKYYEDIKGLKCKRTSYNGNIRKNFASIGYFYDEEKDAFIPPKPYSKWILEENKCLWYPPIAQPDYESLYYWNDNKGEWEIVGGIE